MLRGKERDLTLDNLGAMVVITLEIACRARYEFADQDLIDITQTESSIIDMDGLSEMAD